MTHLPSTNSFTILQDKALTVEVVLGSWCPTMDLLALVTDDGQLSIHRLDWQKLWLACPDVAVSALCWRPDGKVLAAGHQDGSVSFYNVEKCEMFYKSNLHSAPIIHLSWMEAVAPAIKPAHPQLKRSILLCQSCYAAQLQYRHTRFFSCPPIRHDPKAGPQVDITITPSKREWPQPPDQLNMLVCSDARGFITLYALGQVHLASIQLQPPAAAAAASAVSTNIAKASTAVHQAAELRQLQGFLSRDLQHLLTIAASEGSKEQSAPLMLTIYSTHQLHQHQRELCQLAVLSSELTAMLEVAHEGLASAAKEWQQGQQEMTKRMADLRSTLEVHGCEDTDCENEFTIMLATGSISPAMNAFLTNNLTEPGLRRLAKAVDTAVQNVHRLLLDHVQPAVEVLTFLLGEIKGIARSQSTSSTLGLQDFQCCAAELECTKVMLQCECLRLLLTRVGCQYRSFFTWLAKTCLKLLQDAGDTSLGDSTQNALASAPVNINSIIEFLPGQFQHDAIMPDLQDAAPDADSLVGSMSFDSKSLDHAKQISEIMYHQEGGRPTWPDRPLKQQLKVVSGLCQGILRQLHSTLSPQMQPLMQVPLAALPVAGQLRCCLDLPQLRTDPLAGPAWICCQVPASSLPDGQGALLLVRLLLDQQQSMTQVQAGLLVLPPGYEVQDATTYKNAQIALLLSVHDDAVPTTEQQQEREAGEVSATPADAAAAAAMPAGRQHLVLLPMLALELTPVQPANLLAAGMNTLLQVCISQAAVVGLPAEGLRARTSSSSGLYQRPLVMSGPRGVGVVFSSTQRAFVLDMEEDGEADDVEEEEEEQEEEDGGDDDEGGSQVGGEEEMSEDDEGMEG